MRMKRNREAIVSQNKVNEYEEKLYSAANPFPGLQN